MPTLLRDLVPAHPLVHDVPVEVPEERVDVGGAIGLEVDEVSVLVDVECDQRCGVPDREGVLRVADVVEQATLVPIVRGPRPAPAAHARRLQVGAPGLDRAEVALDQAGDRSVGLAAAAAEVLEVDLVVLDPADREGELHLERAELGVDLVCARQVDRRELAEDLVALVHIARVQFVVSFDGLARDAVELVQLRLELPGGDLLELERERGHGTSSSTRGGRAEHILSPGTTWGKGATTWRFSCRTFRIRTTRSSRTSTRRRCGCITTSTTRLTWTTRTRRSKAPNGPTAPSHRSSH